MASRSNHPASLLLATLVLLGEAGCNQVWASDEADLARCTAELGVSPRKIDADDGGAERIAFGPTRKREQRYDFELGGAGRRFVGPITIRSGVGSVDLGCEKVRVAVYGFNEPPDEVVFAFGVSKDRLYNLEFYCSKGGLDWVAYTSTDGTRRSLERASGVCNVDEARSLDADIQFPAVDMRVPSPIGGYTIEGPSIDLPSAGRGAIVLDGVPNSMVVFNGFDCTSNTDCTEPPYHRLDTLIWDPEAGGATFGILEFDLPGNPVNLTTQIRMPGFDTDLEAVPFDAEFTTP